VPTLNGKKNLFIPKGTESGDILKIKGEGFPKLRGYGRGDQIVQIIVKTPKNLTKRQEEILHEFEELGKRKEGGEEGRHDSQQSWKKFFKS
jgi:molecular chaperone DnaJ